MGIIITNNPCLAGRQAVGTGHALSVNENIKNNNLSVIIGSFKSAASKQINQLNKINMGVVPTECKVKVGQGSRMRKKVLIGLEVAVSVGIGVWHMNEKRFEIKWVS